MNLHSNNQFEQGGPSASSTSAISSSLAILQPQPARPAPVFNPTSSTKPISHQQPPSSCVESNMPNQLINMSNNSSCSMTIPPSNIINDGFCNNGLTQTVSGNNLLDSNVIIIYCSLTFIKTSIILLIKSF